MQFLKNIQSVAKYESTLLLRSWFFRVFAVLALLILGAFNFAATQEWSIIAVPGNLPYTILLFLNVGQAVIAIFLSSEFLKRDKKLDTSEVFYVRPLSNAEYVLGKIWGNLRVFFVLNLMIMALTLIANYIASTKGMTIDWEAYLYYFLLISIPTMVFILGLAIFLMLTISNQALTFILLLGYIGVTVFYIKDTFYYLFDYMAFSLPMFKSTIVGIADVDTIINHRLIYLFFGLGFTFFTIALFRRLPNAKHSHYPWIAVGIVFFILGGWKAFAHVNKNLKNDDYRTYCVELNNKYVHTPKIVIDTCILDVKQLEQGIEVSALVEGKALEKSSKYTFCLNPGMEVKSVTIEGKDTPFTREEQILIIDFGKEYEQNEPITLQINYQGSIDERFCYLDIPKEDRMEQITNQYGLQTYNAGQKYVFQQKDFLLYTPETFWYPRPGVAYSNQSPDWQQTYFSNFRLNVTPLDSLVAISQGEQQKKDNGIYSFEPEYPLQSLSLLIGKYEKKSMNIDSIDYNVWYIQGHDYFSVHFDSVMDTIAYIVRDNKENIERFYSLDYPFKRFSLVEIPGQFHTFNRAWTQAQEVMQPEMVLLPEKGFNSWAFNIAQQIKNRKEWGGWGRNGRTQVSDLDAQMSVLYDLIWFFRRTESNFDFSRGKLGKASVETSANPYLIYPELYNFKYNIFSTQWPVANRLIEIYLRNESEENSWMREVNGLSNSEKASLLLKDDSFKDLLANEEHRNIAEAIIGVKASELFAHAEMKLGTSVFRDSLFSILKNHEFENINFETLIDTLGRLGDTDLHSIIAGWTSSANLPEYIIGTPTVTQITSKDEEIYQLELTISNISDYPGLIRLEILNLNTSSQQDVPEDEQAKRIIPFNPHETKRIVTNYDEAPRNININTILSRNLPSVVRQYVTDIPKITKNYVEPSNISVIANDALSVPGEIIVDNEDEQLFELSEPDITGLIPLWINQSTEGDFKYQGIDWRPPIRWTATTNESYYGTSIRSAYVIKNGGGQTATWKVPVPEKGDYEVYYYVTLPEEIRWGGGGHMGPGRGGRGGNQMEYKFQIKYNDEAEDAVIDLRRAQAGWEKLGTYHFDSDTIKIVLSNDTNVRKVTADAVKLIKQ